MEPRRVGRYELVERVARGNQGLLYRGRDTLLDREVAVKILLAGFQDDPDARNRFFQEAKAAARLQHPNIVTTFALGEDDDTPYIVMEFLHGRTLADRLAEGTPVPLTDGLHIAIEACAGLAYAHQHGVLHRAINPGNVWLCNDLTVKLLDCGIATAIASATTVSASLNRTGYLAPEQIASGDFDARSDMFSLGVVLYELFTGRRPFEARSPTAMMLEIVNGEPAPIGPGTNLPPALIGIVMRALAKRPEERFNAIAEFGQALRTVRADLPPEPDLPIVLIEPTVMIRTAAPPDSYRSLGVPARPGQEWPSRGGAALRQLTAAASGRPVLWAVAVLLILAGIAAAALIFR
jgi:serine/threonine-protein kinase